MAAKSCCRYPALDYEAPQKFVMNNFLNKTIWITGASSGIGEALATQLSNTRCNIIISARRLDELNRVSANLSNSAATIHVVELDLASQPSLESAVEKVFKLTNRVDVLILNGGISHRGAVSETLMDVHRRIMEVNYFGTISLTKLVLPYMLNQKYGQIVVISSVVGKFATQLRSAYAASKHALHGFFDALRSEVYNNGIDITIICPGYIRTNISVNALTANGTTHNKMDDNQRNGMEPLTFAKKALKVISARKFEAYIGSKEVLGVYLKRFFPAIFARIIRKRKVT